MGVRAEFDSLRTRLLQSSSNLTMSQALSELLAEETRLKSMSVAPGFSSSSVLAAPQRYGTHKASSSEPCKHCGKTKHTSDNCFSQHPKKLADFRARRAARAARNNGTGSQSRGSGSNGTGSQPRGSVSVAAVSPATSSPSWVLDSGASFHVTSDQSQLASCKPAMDGAFVKTADGTSCSITHKGSLCDSRFSVPNVSFVPQLSMNLLSVGQVTDHNCFVGFDDSSCFVQDRQSGAVIGTGRRRKGAPSLYVLDTLRLPSSNVSSAASASTSSFAQWHHRLGHLCGSRLSNLIESGCLRHTSVQSSFHCKGCKLGKQIQLPYSSSVSHSARPFDLVHSDV